MSGVFHDKKFEELDWISKAVEPINSKINDYLQALPEEIDITFKDFVQFMDSSYGRAFSLETVIQHTISAQKLGLDSWNSSYEERGALIDCFEFQISDDLIIDFETKTLSGPVKVIKIKNTLDEKVLEDLLGKRGQQIFQSAAFREEAVSRMNDLLEILGNRPEGLKSRSIRVKKSALIYGLRTLMSTNQWNIKDSDLADKVGIWMKDYVEDGNLAAYSNLCRLKVMTLKEHAIYSMEEV